MKQLQSGTPVSDKDSDIITHVLSQQCCIVFTLQHGNLYKIHIIKVVECRVIEEDTW